MSIPNGARVDRTAPGDPLADRDFPRIGGSPRTAGRELRVAIADDNRAYRRSLRVGLEASGGLRVIGEAANGNEALALVAATEVQALLMDLHMPGLDGIEATRRVMALPQPPIVLALTAHSGDRLVVQALDAGAVGYLLKDAGLEQVVAAIRTAVAGGAVLSTRVTRPVLDELVRRRDAASDQPDRAADVKLTSAEKNLLHHLTRGVTSNEALASALHVSVNTVRTELRTASAKTGCRDRTQLALWAVRNGFG